jgi:predicted porin
MKRLGLALVASLGLVSLAHAADVLPTTKPAPPPPSPNCFATFWDWLNSSVNDCPLSAGPITLYGTLDVNSAYLNQGVDRSPVADKINYGIQKNAHESIWMLGFNGISTSVLGLKMKQDLGGVGLKGWSLIGVLEAGINPTSGMFFNGPRSLTDNNVRPANTFPWQNTALDSSRAGQWDNSQAFIGVSNNTYGTLTFGRTNSLALDVLSAYDPIGAIAFSLIQFSSSFPGFGNTETVRSNTAFTYRLTYQNFRAAAQVQVGGYGLGNAMNGLYQGQLGADFPKLWGGTPWEGTLSLDGVVSWAKDAVSLSTFGGSNVACITPANCFININNAYFDPNSVLKATLSNNLGVELTAKYKWNALTLYGGYLYARLSNPSDDYLTGFHTIANGIFVPAGFFNKGVYVNNAITDNNYNFDKVLQTYWVGYKWSVLKNLDLAMAFYYQSQNNFNFSINSLGLTVPAACTGHGAFISSSKCGGSQDGISGFIDYRPVPRVDIYGGIMLTNVYGGLANGFFSTQNYSVLVGKKTVTVAATTARTQSYDPTIGIRIRF